GNYEALSIREAVQPRFGTGALLVKGAAAEAQSVATQTGRPNEPWDGSTPAYPSSVSTPDADPPAGRASTRFVGVIELDALRGLSKVGQAFESVINELDRTPDTEFRISLEIQATSESGFPQDVEEVVSDNAETLGFSSTRFD
ncbi:MAG: hypothetical protein AAGH48_10315, partial [Pseudomonadota bacterium]